MKKVLALVGIFIGFIFLTLYIIYRHEPLPLPTLEIPPVTITDDYAEVDARLVKLYNYLASRGMPLAEFSELLLTAADTFKLDWRLLPAIGIRESSGGLHMCGNNPFGWGSCEGYNFKSLDEAITYVSWRLSDSPYYTGKTDYQKLKTYNSVVPTYADEVINIMQQIQSD